MVVWGGDEYPMYASTRPPGAQFGSPERLPNAGHPQRLRFDGSGRAVLLYQGVCSPCRPWVAFAPAGGGFGRGVPLAPQAALWDMDLALTSAGDGLAVWEASGDDLPGGKEVDGAELRSTGEVGPAFRVAVEDDLNPGVRAGLTPSGLAIVGWIDRPSEDLLVPNRAVVSVRPPGGVFSPPRVVSPPGGAGDAVRIAVNESGHAVVGWGARGFPVMLSRVTPDGRVLPPVSLSGRSKGGEPAIALGRTGRAVATWWELEGNSYRQLARSSNGKRLGAISTLASAPAYLRTHSRRACERRARTLRETDTVRVYVDPVYGETVACFKPSFLQVGLDNPDERDRVLHPIAIRGPLVAYAVRTRSRGTLIRVVDMRMRDVAPRFGFSKTADRRNKYAEVTDIAITSTGAAAWIACRADPCARRSPHVVMRVPPGRNPQSLESSRHIASRSLRVDGNTLTWTSNGKKRTARLGP